MLQERRLDFQNSHWLDLTNVSREDLRRVLERYRLPQYLAEDCLDPSHLPKLQRLGDSTFLLLRSYDDKSSLTATSAQATTRKVAALWGDGFFVTIHRSPLPWVDHVWKKWEAKPSREPGQLASVLYDLVEEGIYTYEAPIDLAAESVGELEDRIFAERSTRATASTLLETAYLVKKRSTTFKRLLRLTRDLLPNVSKLGEPGSPTIQSLKEEVDRLYFYSDDLVESANDLIQLSISMSSNRMNEVVRLLTIVSIFLLPLNLVTGVYGMNFEFMPETKSAYGYPLAVGLMVLIELGIYWILRRRGWIRTGQSASTLQ